MSGRLAPVTGAQVRSLMARHRVTIREVAACIGIPMKRIREVRQKGGPWDWPLVIEETARLKASGTVPATWRGRPTYPSAARPGSA